MGFREIRQRENQTVFSLLFKGFAASMNNASRLEVRHTRFHSQLTLSTHTSCRAEAMKCGASHPSSRAAYKLSGSGTGSGTLQPFLGKGDCEKQRRRQHAAEHLHCTPPVCFSESLAGVAAASLSISVLLLANRCFPAKFFTSSGETLANSPGARFTQSCLPSKRLARANKEARSIGQLEPLPGR